MSDSRNVLVTGAANGIGRRLAAELARRGNWVLAADIDTDGLSEASEDVAARGGELATTGLDVTQPADWREAVDRVVEQRGRLDLLVHAAAVAEGGQLIEAEPETIDQQVDVNVKGTMYGTRYVGSQMADQRAGHIVNFGSLASLTPVPGLGIYAATKFSVRGLTLAAAQELRPLGVDVTVVMPDNVDTDLLRKVTEADQMDIALAGAMLTVDDIAEVFFERVLPRRPLEAAIPRVTGLLTRLATVAPEVFYLLRPILETVGASNLEAYRGSQ